jgi:hypothetical protein
LEFILSVRRQADLLPKHPPVPPQFAKGLGPADQDAGPALHYRRRLFLRLGQLRRPVATGLLVIPAPPALNRSGVPCPLDGARSATGFSNKVIIQHLR